MNLTQDHARTLTLKILQEKKMCKILKLFRTHLFEKLSLIYLSKIKYRYLSNVDAIKV